MMSESGPSAMEQLTWSQLVKIYPHIPEEDLKALQDLGANEDLLKETNRSCKTSTDRELKSYMFPDEFYIGQDTDTEVVRTIVVKVVGMTGSGKSAVCNTLLGKKIFEESSSSVPKTDVERKRTDVIMGTSLTVIDTPGSWSITKDIAHVPLYLLVVNLANPQFLQEQLDNLRSITDGTNAPLSRRRCVLLLTHAKEGLKNHEKSIVDYLEEIKGDPLYHLIVSDLETWRVMAISNRTTTQYEREEQQKNLLKLIFRCYKLADMTEGNQGPDCWDCLRSCCPSSCCTLCHCSLQ